MLYLYGITDALAPPERSPLGLENQAAELVLFDGMAAVTSQLMCGRPDASERHLREHFHVVEAFMASHTVLPVRFGTAFPGLGELHAHLERAHDVYSSDLERLRGQIEVSVRVIRRAAPAHTSNGAETFAAADAGPGARYLAEKRALAALNLAQQRQAQDLAEFLTERLAPCATRAEWRTVTAPPDAAGVSMAFLLPKKGLDAFQNAAAALRDSEPGLDILLTGPWPPYSFVSASEGADPMSCIS